MAVRLHYFHSGFAEALRYMLHYGSIEFEDIRYKDYPIKSIKDTLPYGQLPLYQEGDKKLDQYLAIGRYIAHKVGLIPSDPWEQAVLDSVAFSINDFKTHATALFYENDPERHKQLKTKLFEEHHPFYFSRFENTLKENNGYFRGKLSWVDVLLVGIIEMMNLFYNVELDKHYPNIKALIQKIQNLPGVKEYIQKRGPFPKFPSKLK